MLTGAQLYTLVLAGDAAGAKAALAELKTRVKKDNVDMEQVPTYFEAITLALKNPELHSVVWSLLCHLIRRVSVQDPTRRALAEQSALVLPILIERIADAKPLVRAAAAKALETYWLASPQKVEAVLAETGLAHSNVVVVGECVLWLTYIAEKVNPYMKLDGCLHALVRILVQHERNPALVSNVVLLLDTYYKMRHNVLYRNELLRALQSQGVSPLVCARLTSWEPRLAPNLAPPAVGRHSFDNVHLGKSSALAALTASIPLYALDLAIKSQSADEYLLQLAFADMAPHFANKETERNWVLREKSIVKLRAMLRGDLTETRLALVGSVRDHAEGICKGLLSLRTTLAAHSCQFVKELAIILEEDADPLVECFLPTLIRLCLTTKQITLANANVAVCAFLTSTTLHARTSQRIVAAASDKSASMRACSALWLQICILREEAAPDYALRCLPKLLADAALPVRQAAKDAFWLLQEVAPDAAEQLLSRLDANIVKALDRFRTTTSRSASALSRTRPSLRETYRVRDSNMGKNEVFRSSSRGSTGRNTPTQEALQSAGATKPFHLKPSELISRAPSTKSFAPAATTAPLDWRPKAVKGEPLKNSAREALNEVKPPIVTTLEPVDQRVAPNNPLEAIAGQRLSEPKKNSKTVEEKQQPAKTSSKEPYTDPARSVNTEQDDSMKTRSANNPMFELMARCLSSSDAETINEGIQIIVQEHLFETHPNEVKLYLLKLSTARFETLKSLIEGFRREHRNILDPVDFLRLSSLLLLANSALIEKVLAILDSDDVFLAPIQMLTFMCDLELIAQDRHLVFQVIRHKNTMMTFLVPLLTTALSLFSLDEATFERLVDRLFKLVTVAHSSNIVDAYQELLKMLYAANAALFHKTLSLVTKGSKHEVERLVGLDEIKKEEPADAHMDAADSMDHNLSPLKGFAGFKGPAANESKLELSPIKTEPRTGVELSPLKTEFTMVFPGNVNLSPLKAPLEFTMVWPKAGLDKEPVYDSIIEDEDVAMDHDQPTETLETEATCPDKGSNVKVVKEAASIPVLHQSPVSAAFQQMSQQLENLQRSANESEENVSTTPPPFSNDEVDMQCDANNSPFEDTPEALDLVDNFAQVKITNRANDIQQFIDKIDPINRISRRNRPIAIYEDGMSTSPQRVREYSYTEFNWFNFLVAQMAFGPETGAEIQILRFSELCEDLKCGQISSVHFYELLRFFQHSSDDFSGYFSREGHGVLEQALWAYLGNCSDESKRLRGLLLVKQLLVVRGRVDLESLWNMLVEYSSGSPEIAIAVGETFDEALCGLYGSGEIMGFVLRSLKDPLKDQELLFAVELLYKLVLMKTLALSMNGEFVQKIDSVLHDRLVHGNLAVRKAVVQTYGRLMRAVRMETGKTLFGKKDMEEVLQRVSRAQRRIIEYYSK